MLVQISLILIKQTCIMKKAGTVTALNKKYKELKTKLKGKFIKILVKIWQRRHQYQIILPERSW
jgi:hypothetical protein